MGAIGTITLIHRVLGLVGSLTCDPRIPSPLGIARSNMSYLYARYRKQLSRRDLAKLTDEQLADIGLGRGDAEAEARKPFWI